MPYSNILSYEEVNYGSASHGDSVIQTTVNKVYYFGTTLSFNKVCHTPVEAKGACNMCNM